MPSPSLSCNAVTLNCATSPTELASLVTISRQARTVVLVMGPEMKKLVVLAVLVAARMVEISRHSKRKKGGLPRTTALAVKVLLEGTSWFPGVWRKVGETRTFNTAERLRIDPAASVTRTS